MASMNFDFEDALALDFPRDEDLSAKKKREPPGQDESDLEPTKCRYQPGVLVGDWFERRANYEPPPNDWLTVYNTTYTCKSNPDLKKDRRYADDIRSRGEQGLGSEFLLEYPENTFHRNFTTMNDLSYRIIPLGLCGPPTRTYCSRKDQWLPEIDLSKNYGNLKKFGLTEAVECENYINSSPSPRESIQKSHFKKPKSSDFKTTKRFPRPIGRMNDPCLCHLDIDPDLPFRPHLIKSKS